MNKMQQCGEVVEKLLLRDITEMVLTPRESMALNKILLHMNLKGEYTLPDHLKIVE